MKQLNAVVIINDNKRVHILSKRVYMLELIRTWRKGHCLHVWILFRLCSQVYLIMLIVYL